MFGRPREAHIPQPISSLPDILPHALKSIQVVLLAGLFFLQR